MSEAHPTPEAASAFGTHDPAVTDGELAIPAPLPAAADGSIEIREGRLHVTDPVGEGDPSGRLELAGDIGDPSDFHRWACPRSRVGQRCA